MAHHNAQKRQASDATPINPNPANLKLPPAADEEEEAERWERVQRRREEAARHERRAAALSAARNGCGVPERYIGARLDGHFPGVESVPDKLRRLVEKLRAMAQYQGQPPRLAGEGLLALVGKYRAGKTWVAAGLVNEVVEQGVSPHAGHFTSTWQFFQDLKDAMSPATRETPGHVVQRYLRFHVLVLDEITNRSDTEWENVSLRHLLARRYDEKRITVVLGNVESSQLRDALDNALVERFIESGRIGGGGIIDCNWDLQLKRQRKGD